MIDFDNLKSYKDYSKLTGNDILEFMQEQTRNDIEEFKEFCKPHIETDENGITHEYQPRFFEIRNWVLDKYYPGLTTPKKNMSFMERIMDL